jgi:predicted transposase YbfD/YdcC
LAALDLRDQVVTADAMLTQRELCAQIVAAGGAYVLPVKANQVLLQQAIAESFLAPPPSHGYCQSPLSTVSAQSVSSGHGRIEYRWLDAHSHLNNYLDWPHLAQVFRLRRVVQRQKTGKLTYEVVFGITSLTPQQAIPQQLLHFVRRHWHIENRLHYVRDVSFHEDGCKVRHPPRQRFLAALNNLAIGLIRGCDFDFIPQARRHFAIHYHEALQLLC